ncbi:hypothetical protein FGO68_gene4690 [Halteria grandinella]|uniref:Uncharacterized protein n=1 Tax=Halteria grandinella TaxID=5974 RepID=A0A8J8NAW1_HALGN|nr:hypothetical protein FGO68_gene4690 [Halteria grandinella]
MSILVHIHTDIQQTTRILNLLQVVINQQWGQALTSGSVFSSLSIGKRALSLCLFIFDQQYISIIKMFQELKFNHHALQSAKFESFFQNIEQNILSIKFFKIDLEEDLLIQQ